MNYNELGMWLLHSLAALCHREENASHNKINDICSVNASCSDCNINLGHSLLQRERKCEALSSYENTRNSPEILKKSILLEMNKDM